MRSRRNEILGRMRFWMECASGKNEIPGDYRERQGMDPCFFFLLGGAVVSTRLPVSV